MARVWASKAPSKAALIDAGRVVTYAQLNDRSNRIANALTAAGIRPGSHIGFLGKNSATFFEIEAMWGYALCGAVMERSQQFFDKADRLASRATATPL
jgi:acyl-CoA synthetase (AMP-forming)/AMP-acid ligase II